MVINVQIIIQKLLILVNLYMEDIMQAQFNKDYAME